MKLYEFIKSFFRKQQENSKYVNASLDWIRMFTLLEESLTNMDFEDTVFYRFEDVYHPDMDRNKVSMDIMVDECFSKMIRPVEPSRLLTEIKNDTITISIVKWDEETKIYQLPEKIFECPRSVMHNIPDTDIDVQPFTVTLSVTARQRFHVYAHDEEEAKEKIKEYELEGSDFLSDFSSYVDKGHGECAWCDEFPEVIVEKGFKPLIEL